MAFWLVCLPLLKPSEWLIPYFMDFASQEKSTWGSPISLSQCIDVNRQARLTQPRDFTNLTRKSNAYTSQDTNTSHSLVSKVRHGKDNLDIADEGALPLTDAGIHLCAHFCFLVL